MKLYEKEFYDYKTALVDGDNVVDLHTTGVSFYNDFLSSNMNDIKYLRDKHNLEGEVIMMSPEEYFKQCSEYGFPGRTPSVEKLKLERRRDIKTLNHLKDVLTDYKHRFPMPYINKAENAQEGLHRMMVIGDMFGWNHKVPVLVVDYADKERAAVEKEQKRSEMIRSYIKQAVSKSLEYKYTNIEELREQLQWELDKAFEFYDDISTPVQFELTSDEENKKFTVAINNVDYSFDYEDVQFIDKIDDPDIDIDDFDIEETEDFLRRYFGDDWEKTHPHLKDTFRINEVF